MRIGVFRRPRPQPFVVGSTLFALLACSNPGAVDAPDEPGAFSIGHASFSVVDANRDNRSLLVDVWYPVDPEDVSTDAAPAKYALLGSVGLESDAAFSELPVSQQGERPLLVFSHGYQAIHIQSIELMEALASHGFIVVSPEHTGNAQSSATDSFDDAAANRVPDVSLLIDAMIARGSNIEDAFFERIDETRIGVIGHSFGGMTAIGSAAGWAGAEPDPRVNAIAPISAVIDPTLQSESRDSPNAGFSSEQLATITIPVLLVGGTEDVSVPIGNNAIAFEQLTNAEVVYKVDIVGANHTHFAAVCAIGNFLIDLGFGKNTWTALGAEDLLEPYNATCTPDVFPITEAQRLLNLYAVSFFKRHLLGQRRYERFLTESFAKTESSIVFSAK